MELPKYSAYDHAIDFKDNTKPPWGPIYLLNEAELEELRRWLKKMTNLGAVRESKSFCSSPMLFVPKGHGQGLCLCKGRGRRYSRLDGTRERVNGQGTRAVDS